VSPEPQIAAPAEPPRVGGRLRRELRLVQRLLEEHRGSGGGPLRAPAALDVIDLFRRSLLWASWTRRRIRAAGALLWAREVEAAGLPSFVDALADRVLQGKLLLDITTAGDRLMLYRRARTQRFSPEERAAILRAHLRRAVQGGIGSGCSARSTPSLARRAMRPERTDSPGRGGGARRRPAALAAVRRDRHLRGALIAEQVQRRFGVLRDPDLMRALGGSNLGR